jgi:hypothetical protein
MVLFLEGPALIPGVHDQAPGADGDKRQTWSLTTSYDPDDFCSHESPPFCFSAACSAHIQEIVVVSSGQVGGKKRKHLPGWDAVYVARIFVLIWFRFNPRESEKKKRPMRSLSNGYCGIPGNQLPLHGSADQVAGPIACRCL